MGSGRSASRSPSVAGSPTDLGRSSFRGLAATRRHRCSEPDPPKRQHWCASRAGRTSGSRGSTTPSTGSNSYAPRGSLPTPITSCSRIASAAVALIRRTCSRPTRSPPTRSPSNPFSSNPFSSNPFSSNPFSVQPVLVQPVGRQLGELRPAEPAPAAGDGRVRTGDAGVPAIRPATALRPPGGRSLPAPASAHRWRPAAATGRGHRHRHRHRNVAPGGS